MEQNDIDKKMMEAWNDQARQQPQDEKQAAWNEFSAAAFPAKKRYKKWLYPGVAAMLALTIGIWALTMVNGNQPQKNALAYTIIENPSLELKTITLPDSSVVELEPDAEICFSENFTTNRQVGLKGKAFFKVRKDKKHPFTVNCQETTTTVLGTAFTVNGISKNTVQVNLYEGRVQMNVKGKNNNWILAPGEQFVYRNNLVSVEAFNRFRDFNDVKVVAVLQYIDSTYGYHAKMPNEYLTKTITLRLNRKEKLENVVGIMSQMFNLNPTIDEKKKKIDFN
jgi:ferric-dicitrate binding protein FerR (iron transport regulator)